MKNTYLNLIKQSYNFPQEGFDIKAGYLTFQGISLKYLIGKYKTPFKILYLPRIAEQIKKAQNLFNEAIKINKYAGKYHYCYCTKSCHFSPVVKSALRQGAHIETSSSFDIDLIFKLFEQGEISQQCYIVHNGYKTDEYLQKIILLNKKGFKNSLLVLDTKSEIQRIKDYAKQYKGALTIGIRIAINQEDESAYRTSRFGIPANKIVQFYLEEIKDIASINLKMVHFFIDSGIKDSLYYWQEFQKVLHLFIELKKVCPSIDALNLGGGFPIRNSLNFSYNYEQIVNQLVVHIKTACSKSNIDEPDIFTEFGKYTVGESGAVIFSVLEQKQQNDEELWYIIDNSLMSTIPDMYTIQEKFIALPVNKWTNSFKKVNIGGLSCDYYDFYNTEQLGKKICLPTFNKSENEPLYFGFFHTGAYQDSLSAYGGVKHCLIPTPKLIMIDRDKDNELVETVYFDQQNDEEILKVLGYE